MVSSESIYRAKDLLLARVVCGIDIVKLQGRAAVNLHDDFAGSHRVVMHVGIEIGEAAGRERPHLVFVEGVSHPNLERARDDRDVLAQGMPVGRDAISVWHFQTNGVVAAGGARVALDYCELRTRGDERWRRTPRNGVWGERVFVVASMCSDREELACK